MEILSRVGRALARRVTYGRFFLFARRNSHANLRGLSGRNILVLCYGNIYRSPFVGKLLADLLPTASGAFARQDSTTGRAGLAARISSSLRPGPVLTCMTISLAG